MTSNHYMQLEGLSVYEIQCYPVNKDGIVPLDYILYVVATNSTEATRKAVKYFQTTFPEDGIKAIEVVSFRITLAEKERLKVVV